jgi:hypothetical protein
LLLEHAGNNNCLDSDEQQVISDISMDVLVSSNP